MREKVSWAVVRRLPRYYRYLRELMRNDIQKISSKELSEKIGFTASQIRQDFNCFGGFGQQGYGYNVEYLYNEIGAILGIEQQYKMILVGVGHLGHAVVNHITFERRGFTLVGMFDNDPVKVGGKVGEYTILPMQALEDFCRRVKPTAAILTVPRQAANEVAATLVELGIKGFWNFSNGDLSLPGQDVQIENVHLGDSLMTLCFRLNESGVKNAEEE